MTEINPELVERYQLMLQGDPKSKVFAPLAEAYRKMGLIDEGIAVCEKGLEFHPSFASGRVALGRLFIVKNRLKEAADQLERAVELSPENLLAQSLLGETHLKLKQPKEALKAFKMLLLLNPLDEKAQSTIRRLESLTADEYDDDVFAMAKLNQAAGRVGELTIEAPEALKPLPSDSNSVTRDLDRHLSLADAFMVRNDFERAEQTLINAEKIHGTHKEIVRRLKLLNQRFLDDESAAEMAPPPSRKQTAQEGQIALLKELKRRVLARSEPNA